MNKLMSKQLYQQVGLPVPSYLALKRSDTLDSADIAARLGLPVVIKPVQGGSSVGMSIVRSEKDLPGAIQKAFDYDTSVLVEAYIDGIEITGGVLGNSEPEALPLIEIIPDKSHEFFDYEAKYTAGVTQEICPARIDEALTEKARTYAVMAHEVLGCRGYSRTDLMLKGRDLFVLETNTIPGMTATSLFPQAAAAAGFPFGQLLDRLIELSLEGR
jgi:D-alanine-D-alanine ligase